MALAQAKEVFPTPLFVMKRLPAIAVAFAPVSPGQ
jgi:hypothetical protein